jgi:hypothetical protein
MSQVLYKYFNANYEDNQTKNKVESNRIKNLLKENSDLIERNKNLEQRLKILEQYVSTNPVQTNNANIYNINLSNNNNPPSLKNKQRKSAQFHKYNKKSINISKSNNLSKSTKKIRPKILNERNKKNNLTINNFDTKRNKTNLSYNLNRAKNFETDTINSKKEFNFKERNEYNLKILNEMIEEKKNEIDSLEYELKLQLLAEKGEGYLDYELDLWQKKTNTLSTSFYQQFNNLKSEAYLDKNEFQNLIRNMKKICEKNQSYEENICQEVINKQTFFINSLDNKNKDIKRRLEKMKNVFK